jgi:hypothetical protein
LKYGVGDREEGREPFVGHWEQKAPLSESLQEKAPIKTRAEKFHVEWKRVLRCEVFMAVTMKNGVFWDVTLCASCKN